MDLTDYTTYDDIRAALGVSGEELEDETLALEVYASGVSEDLYDISSTLTAVYTAIEAKAEGDRSDKEIRAYRMVRLFVVYSTAKQLGAALPMLAPKSVSDGKASMSRFAGEPYKEVLKRISEQYDLFRGRLIQALADLTSETTVATTRTHFRVASPIYDPVTGA